MAVTALSSFWIKGPLGRDWLDGFSFIHGLSLWTLVSLVIAVNLARQRKIQAHRRWMQTTFISLIVAGLLAAASPGRVLNNLLFSANLGSAITLLKLGESLGVSRERMCEVVTRGSANSKAMGSIAMFGGSLDNLAPIAGGLLQKDVRLAASLAGAVDAPEEAVFDAADAALENMGHPR